MKIVKLVLIFFVSILLLFFNFILLIPGKQGKDLNSCLAEVFNKSSLSYKDQCIKAGGIILDSGVCNFYALKEKAINGDQNVDPEIGDCLRMFGE